MVGVRGKGGLRRAYEHGWVRLKRGWGVHTYDLSVGRRVDRDGAEKKEVLGRLMLLLHFFRHCLAFCFCVNFVRVTLSVV